MKWKEHSNLKEKHAFLGASKYAWLNYDPKKLVQVYLNHLAVQKGTELHEFAATAIKLKQKLRMRNKTLNLYVNDAISFKMIPEQVLYYSDKCFGTADAIIFNDNLLRIHDLKTGTHKASFRQLEIYAALFCLEYDMDPETMNFELRIYQNDEVRIDIPEQIRIRNIMNKIVEYDKVLDAYWEE